MKEEEVAFRNERGRRLAAVIMRPDLGEPAAMAVLCHGMLSGKNSPKHVALSERLAARDIATLRFDFTSRYGSEGPIEELTYTHQVLDLEAAVNFARETFGPLPLGIYGSSMGGAVALLYTARLGNVNALATISAVGRPGDLWSAWLGEEKKAQWRKEGWIELQGIRLPWSFYMEATTKDAIGAAACVRCPLLVVHGAKDTVVPVAQAREIHAAAAGEKKLVILPEADHSYSRPEDLERMLQEVAGWLQTNLL
jgi:alpha-beta hydrolase superfamily lysophospholipase